MTSVMSSVASTLGRLVPQRETPAETIVASLSAALWPRGDDITSPQVFAVLDGARDQRVEPMLRLCRRDYTSLFSGKMIPAFFAASPFIVHLAQASAFTRELIEFSWTRSCAMFLVTGPEVTLQQTRRHLRDLLRVQDEKGKRYFFRFYDPRVLRAYLPTCTGAEAQTFFGPTTRIYCEPEKPGQWLEFTPHSLGVTTKLVPTQTK